MAADDEVVDAELVDDDFEPTEEMLELLNDPTNRMIWDLRVRAGVTMDNVADQVGIARKTAYNRLNRVVDAIPGLSPEEVIAYRKEQVAQIEELEALVAQARLHVNPRDTLAVTRVVNATTKVMQRKARLLALDAPQVIRIEGVAVSPLLDERQRLRDSIAALEAAPDLQEAS